MEASLQKELKQLQKRKLKAQGKSDILEEAKLCNAAGELLSQYGYYQKAVKEHTQEVQLSEAAQDTIGCAIAHRKVGECLCALNKYKEALFHQNLHLQLARSAGNLVEEQRAFATIGRTWFVHSDVTTNSDEVEECLLESQSAYLKSLSVCDKLRDTVTEKELLEMRSRLYLNLGLTYENQKDPSRAKRFIEKALVIARDQGLKDTEYRCLYSIGSVRTRADEDAYALRCFEQALQVARQGNNKFDEADALLMLGKIFLKLGEFSAGRRNLKKAYVILKARRSDDMEDLKSSLLAAIKGIKLLRKQAKLSEYSLDEQIKILEALGDLYCQVRSFRKALGCYKKELELASAAGKPVKVLSTIYVSLAITYSDLKCPSDAVSCYMEELEMTKGNYKETCDTWCNIANVHEIADHGYEQIKEAYMKALEYAELSGKPQVMLRVWKCLADTQKLFGKTEEQNKSSEKVSELESEFGAMEDDSDEEKENEIQEEDEDKETLIEREMLLPDSDDDDGDQDEDEPQSKNASISTRTRKRQRGQLNEKGETPLHEAAIAGNLQRVKALLEKGSNVNARDYCGWLPLHEACNHGHKEIAALLLKAGANVNDQGGSHCQGITPLHDAAANGQIEVVKVLLSHNASVNLKDNNGLTALDTAIKLQKIDEEDDGSGNNETEFTIGRRHVIKFLRHFKGGRNDTEIKSRNALFDEDDMDEDRTRLERSNERLKRREHERMQRLRQSVTVESSQEDSEEMQPSALMSMALISDEDDSPESPCEFSTHPASSFIVLPRTSSDATDTLQKGDYSVGSRVPVVLGNDDQTFSDIEEIDGCDNDSTYASMDEDYGVEVFNDGYRSTSSESSSVSFIDPLTGIISGGHGSSRQPSALVTDRTSGSTDWLVDDVGQRITKRKRPARQTKLSLSVEQRRRRTPSVPGRTAQRTGLSTSRGSRPKQSRLVVSKGPTVNQNVHSPVHTVNLIASPTSCRPSVSSSHSATVNSRVNTPVPSEGHTVFMGGTPPMRLRVRVQEKVFLIPCPKGRAQGTKNVGWLAEQASLRYFSSFGLRPLLALKTSEGAFLSPEDKVTDVLSNNEEVIASVESWDLPALSERYRKACINANTSMTPDILHVLEAEPQLSTLNLPNKALQDLHVLPLFRALQCHDCLTKLLLPGNRIGDTGIQHLVSALPTLPSLAILDLRSNGITHKGVTFIASALTARESPGHGTQQGSKPLQKLEELDIGFNWLCDPVSSSLACVLQHCPILTTLRIDSCGLTSQVTTQGKEFSIALKASKLQQLFVSYNSLGPLGVINLITALPSTSLHHFNLASSMGEKASQSAVQSLMEFMESGCVLHDVVLGDCNIGSKELELLTQTRHCLNGLQRLDLSCNNIESDASPSLTRLLQQNTSLSTLILAGNEGLGSKGAESVFSLTKDCISLQNLDMSACGVKSPLVETFFEAVRRPSSQSQGTGFMKEVDLSHNELSAADKQRLAEEWDEYCTGESLSYLDNNLCVLSKP